MQGQGGGHLTRLVSTLDSALEKAFYLETHAQETGCPSGGEEMLAGESCVEGTVLVLLHPTDLLAAVAAAFAPFLAGQSLSAGVVGSCLAAAEVVRSAVVASGQAAGQEPSAVVLLAAEPASAVFASTVVAVVL